MKYYLLVLLSFLLLPVFTLAALDVTFSGSAVISVGGNNFTVSSATIDSITVNPSSFDVVLSPGASFTVSSSDRKAFTITPSEAYLSSRTCDSTQSAITLAMPSTHPGPSTIVTVTPSSSTCSGAGGETALGGGIPGSVSAGASVPTPVYAVIPGTAATSSTVTVPSTTAAPAQAGGLTQTQIDTIISLLQVFDVDLTIINNVRSILAATPTAPAVAQPSAIAISVSPVFTFGLERGMSGPDVKRLQQLLNSDSDTIVAESGPGSMGQETEYFGPLTEKAVQKFQKKYGITQEGDPAFGYVGPKTRAKLGEVFK